MLLPSEGNAGATALRLASNGIGIPRRLIHLGLSFAVRARVAPLVLRDLVIPMEEGWTLRAYLEDVLDVRPLWYTVLVGTPRPNRKPVLVIADRAGHVISYGKVGWNHSSIDLIRAEAHALRALPATTTTFRAPRVLHLGRWGRCEIMLLSPLPQDRRWYKSKDLALPLRPTVEVATGHGTVREELASSQYWAGLVRRSERLAQRISPEARGAVDSQIEGIGRRFGEVALTFGSWHGDWGPWNMSWCRGSLSVWDWERSSRPVPVGFDALHFVLQVARQHRADLHRALADLTERTETILAAFGEHDRQVGRATRTLYLTELMYRRLEPLSHGGTVDRATVSGIRERIEKEIVHG